ncbi:MAG: iron-sulfur cluster assembly scaffold protein [Candidatus Pacebacteria bacterium]|nr:iron-sulfur cluster assembly scaffold protein [Candidatus Paceibacterota bacterium]MDD5013355.1 iron-sulfur cluster assembly scaffold protein [Candidatus Paceibacterota bacterium]MDD5753027.1 iron-sulfur cluster assembly scaffold protein [Candidatus Paceibacterota bacterium]
MSNYNKKVLKYFLNPKNRGKIKKPDGVGMVGNPVCGDIMKIYIKVSKDEIIENIGFETLGCVAAVASSSITTEMAKGKTLKQALKIKKDDIVKELTGLPKEKVHCSVLANQALKKAIENYYSKLPASTTSTAKTSSCSASTKSTASTRSRSH